MICVQRKVTVTFTNLPPPNCSGIIVYKFKTPRLYSQSFLYFNYNIKEYMYFPKQRLTQLIHFTITFFSSNVAHPNRSFQLQSLSFHGKRRGSSGNSTGFLGVNCLCIHEFLFFRLKYNNNEPTFLFQHTSLNQSFMN